MTILAAVAVIFGVCALVGWVERRLAPRYPDPYYPDRPHVCPKPRPYDWSRDL